MSRLTGNSTLFEEWEFHNTEEIKTYSKRQILEKTFNDAIQKGYENYNKVQNFFCRGE